MIRQILLVTAILLLPVLGFASDNTLEQYITSFTYDSRLEMKANSKQLIDMLEDLDDVQNVYGNYEISEAEMARLAG